MTELGIALALACAATANVGMLCKHRGARETPEIRFRHPLRSGVALFRSRWWAIGFAVATLAWLFHIAAMALAPLSTVQAVVAAGIVLLAYPAQRWFGHRLGRREWAGLGLAAVGLGFLAVTLPAADSDAGYSVTGLVAFEFAAIGAGVALLVSGSVRETGPGHALALGTASGLLIGVSNVAIKALTEIVPSDVLALLGPWTLVAALAGAGAFFALARGMQLGEAIPVIATASVGANCSAILGGVIVFGDPIGSDVIEGIARGLAFIAVIAAAALMPTPHRTARAT
jgi:multidrug transporter EmrE-like cation transporter